MKFKSPLLLAIIFLILFGYLYYYEMPKQENMALEKQTEERVFAFNPKEVKSFSFKFEHDLIDIKRIEGTDEFVIDGIDNFKADSEVVNKIMSDLNAVKYEKTFDATDRDPKEFNLLIPHYQITLRFNDGAEKVFNFGALTSTGDMIYASRNDDNRVFMVKLDVRDILDFVPNDFRNRTIISANLGDMKNIHIVRGTDEIILTKKSEDWIITKPKNVKADIVETRALISNIQNLKALKFPDDDVKDADKCDFTKSDYSLIISDSSDNVITAINIIKKGPKSQKRLTSDEAEKQACLTGEVDNTIDTSFLKKTTDDGVYLITFKDFQFLDKSLTALRDKSVFSLNKDDVAKIEIMRNHKLLTLARDKNGNWMNASNKDNPLSYSNESITSIFNYLTFVQATEFIDDADLNDKTYDLKNATLSLAFYDKNGAVLERLITGKISGEYVFLQRYNDKTVYMIEKAFLDRFIM